MGRKKVSNKSVLDSLGIVGTTLRKIGDFWKKQEKPRQRLIIVLGVSGLVVAIVMTMLLNTTNYAVLFTNLSPSDAGEIMQQLKDSGVEAKAQGEDTILVPSDLVDSLRMDLAASGFPKNSTNLNILEQSTGFGVTDADKQIYRRYQLQQDLEGAIKSFDCILDAKVSLNIPETSSFVIEDQRTPATAAVLLTMRVGTSLTTGNVAAITALVEKSVPGLTTANISIMDSNMNVLSVSDPSGEVGAGDQLTIQQQIGEKLKKQVLSLLQPVFGTDNVLAEVSVTLNFDDTTKESITFQPLEGNSTGIASSIDKIKESSNNGTPSDSTSTGTDSNGGTAVPSSSDSSAYEKTTESINYEINTIKETLVKAKGTISSLSVSVILDSSDENATDYSDNVRKLVATAIGVSEEYITVDNLPFSGVASQQDTWESYQATNDKAMAWEQTRFFILLGAGLLVGILLLSFIFKAIKGAASSSGSGSGSTSLARRSNKEQQIADLMPSLRQPNNRLDLQKAYASAAAAGSAEFDQEQLTLALLNDASSIQRRKIESYFDSNPEIATSIIRNWLNDEGK